MAAIQDALRASDPGQAQQLLDRLGEAIVPRQRATLQARCCLLAGDPKAARKALEEIETPKPAELRLLARACLEGGDAKAALTAVEAAVQADPGPAKVQDSLLQLRAAMALQDQDRVINLADQAQARHPGDRAVRRQSVLALIAVEASDEAARLIATLTKEDKVPTGAHVDFIAGGLRRGCGGALARGQPAIARLSEGRFDVFLTLAWGKLTAEDQRSAACGALHELALTAGEPATLGTAVRLLAKAGQDEASVDLVQQYRARNGHMRPHSPAQNPARPAALREVPQGARFRSWLGLPADAPADWTAAVWQGSAYRKQIITDFQADPDAWDQFMESVQTSDLSLLRGLSEAGQPAIMATSHAGVLMGTLAQLEKANIPVEIIGGKVVLSRVLKGGGRLRPIPKGQSATGTARQILRYIQNGQIVGLASDGRQGSELYRVRHGGLTFSLPDSIPQLAHRFGLPIVWVASYWKDGRIITDCEAGPEVAADEPFEAFRQRWFDFALDRMRLICLASARNATPILRLIEKDSPGG